MMKLYPSLEVAPKREPVVVALGFFDGLHIGHQRVIEEAKNIAREVSAKVCVITFYPHPRTVLMPSEHIYLLGNREEKIELLQNLKVDFGVLLTPTVSFLQMSPDSFLRLLDKNLELVGIVSGENFTFGREASGTVKNIKEYFKNRKIKISTIPLTSSAAINGDIISSTIIRKLLLQGQVKNANKLLGHAYSLRGKVVHGIRRGHDITGYPTVNLQTDSVQLIPKDGVYVTYVDLQNKRYLSVTNIGKNPTFENKERTIETFIMDFQGDLYEQDIRLTFIERLRGEIKFLSVGELIRQIQLDIEQANKYK
ncbi:MAG: bifunctional riboflavin kinase/FAD synthetase [Dialister pneumosintes]